MSDTDSSSRISVGPQERCGVTVVLFDVGKELSLEIERGREDAPVYILRGSVEAKEGNSSVPVSTRRAASPALIWAEPPQST